MTDAIHYRPIGMQHRVRFIAPADLRRCHGVHGAVVHWTGKI